MPEPKYQRIADDLLLQIEQGVLRPGDRLPSEPELCQAYKASRNTVRLGIAALMNRGLVVPRQGLGTFVTDEIIPYTVRLSAEKGWQSEAAPGGGSGYVHAVKMAGRDPQTLRFVVEIHPAADDVAARLDVEPGDSVVLRHAERLIDGRPWSMLSSFYPLDIARGTPLELAGSIQQGVIRLLAELGYEQVSYRDEITARMPDAAEHSFFQLPAGVPLVVVDRTAYDAERPIRFTRHIYPADRNRLAYDIGVLPGRYAAVSQPPKPQTEAQPTAQASLPPSGVPPSGVPPSGAGG